MPGYEANLWLSISGPAGMPAAVVQRLYAEISKALRDPELQASFRKDPQAMRGRHTGFSLNERSAGCLHLQPPGVQQRLGVAAGLGLALETQVQRRPPFSAPVQNSQNVSI